MAAASIYVLRVSPSCLLPLQKSLQDQQVGLIQAPFKLLLLLWVLVYVRLCVCPLRIEYYLHIVFWFSKMQAHWPLKLYILGNNLPS